MLKLVVNLLTYFFFLFVRGDYEIALILYHRASKLYPHDASHIIAARKIKASIKNEYLKSDSNIIKYNIDNKAIKSR